MSKNTKEIELKKWMRRQNKILEDWFMRNYGKRCPDYEKSCIVCKDYKMLDKLKYQEEDFV